MKDNLKMTIGGAEIPYAAFLLVIALVVWMAFWFMDRHWYHRLLLGSVRHGLKVEKSLEPLIPEIALSESIKKESPANILGRRVASTQRLNLFYWVIAVVLAIGAIAFVQPTWGLWAVGVFLILLLIYLFRWSEPYKKEG
jgi:hypothetical protein